MISRPLSPLLSKILTNYCNVSYQTLSEGTNLCSEVKFVDLASLSGLAI